MGGAEQVLHTLCAALNDDFEQHVIFFHDGPYRAKLAALGIATTHIGGRWHRYDPFFFVRLYRAIKAYAPDVIHTLLWAANVSTRLVLLVRRTPIISAYHNQLDGEHMLRALLDRCTMARSDKLIAVSAAVADSLVRCNRWLPAERVTVIDNGAELPTNKRMKTRAELSLPDDAFVIGAIGRFVPIKQFDLLLHICAKLFAAHKGMYLVLIGYGQLEQQLRALAQSLGIGDRVRFVIGEPAQPYLPLFDCFVQPTAAEGLSIALLEAMMACVPPVVMSVDGSHPVVQPMVCGYVIPADTPDALAHAIEALYTVVPWRKTLGEQARRRVDEHFSAAAMAFKYKTLFGGFVHKNF